MTILCERCGKTLVRTYYLVGGEMACLKCAQRGQIDAPWPHVLGGQGRDADSIERDGEACAVYGAAFMACVLAWVIYYVVAG